MARYTGADCKRCRREKMKLFLKGAKCESPKCPIEIRPYPPGEHGRGRTKDSEYLLQMREKQKCARIYGVLEKQFRGYYEEANRRKGKTGEELLRILESRLDNVVYRAGFAPSRDAARQLVRHGHFTVNGRKVDIPSYSVKAGDVIGVRSTSAQNPTIQHALEEVKGRGVPEWLSFDAGSMTGRIASLPTREQINLPVQEQLIVELYSK
jgi:small subunit ribosomal protein S4